MKLKIFLSVLFLSFFFISCNNDEEYETVSVAKPETMSLIDFRASVKIELPTEIIESGKIFVYNNLVLVGDVHQGIHIIDNSNTKNPQKIAFIKILGNRDMGIKGNYLYADSYMDLLVFDLSDINNIKQIARLEDVLQTIMLAPAIDHVYVDYENFDGNGVIIGWNITQETRRIGEGIQENIGIFFNNIATATSSESTTGQGGSLARFKIVNDYLYAVDSHNINIFHINNLESPKVLDAIYAGFDIETIFNRGNHLFLGSMRGMYIYNIDSPATPIFVSEFQHGTACDPVVVDKNYAYITLRAGNNCGALDSSLEIVDITNIGTPVLVKSYEMDNPYGLGIKDDLLFICDGTLGLKVYNKLNVEEITLLNHFKNINTYDVIPLDKNLLMIGDNILYQYSYTDNNITLLSEFSLN